MEQMLRSRSKGGFAVLVGKYVDDDWNCTSGHQEINTSLAIIGEQSTFEDVVTHGYNRLSRLGRLIVSPMRKVRTIQNATGMFAGTAAVSLNVPACTPTNKRHYWRMDGPAALYYMNSNTAKALVPQTAFTSSEIDQAISVAATSCWAQTAQHSADVLQDLAEYKQTLNMLKNPTQLSLGRLDDILKNPANLKLRRTISAFNWARNMWLQYRFGVRPLISSVQGVVKVLQQGTPPRRVTSRGSFTAHKASSGATLTFNVPTYDVKFDYVYSVDDTISVRCGVIMEESIGVQARMGIDASGMLALPWELLPYSFVADWFVNVSSYIGSLIPYLTKRPVAQWTTVKRTTVTKLVISNARSIAGIVTLTRGCSEVYTCTVETTERFPTVKHPSMVFKPQALQSILADARTVDGLALISQRIRFLNVANF